MNMLYHYTSIDTLCGIFNQYISDKKNNNWNDNDGHITLWASSIYHMNDPKEMIFGYRFLKKIIPALETYNGIDDRLFEIKNLFEKDGLTEDQFLHELEKHFFNLEKNPFVLSFSRNEDNLPMWRLYGSNGNGVCLGFKDEISQYNWQNAMYSGDVNYGEKINDEVLIKLLNNEITESSKKLETMDQKKASTKKIIALSTLIAIICPFIKTPQYSYENEYRISFYDKNNDVNFRTSNNKIVPYLPVKIPIKYLQEITLGSYLKDFCHKRGIYHLLLSSSLNIEIKESNVDFRQ